MSQLEAEILQYRLFTNHIWTSIDSNQQIMVGIWRIHGLFQANFQSSRSFILILKLFSTSGYIFTLYVRMENCNFAKCEFRQLANFPKTFAILNEFSRNPVRVLDMLTDQTELAMMYESRTVKRYSWRNSNLAKLQKAVRINDDLRYSVLHVIRNLDSVSLAMFNPYKTCFLQSIMGRRPICHDL